MPPRCATISIASRKGGGRRAEAHGLVGAAFAALFFCPAVISCEICNSFIFLHARRRRCRVPAGCGIARLRVFPVSGFPGAAVPFGELQKAARGLAEFCIVLSAEYSSTFRKVRWRLPQGVTSCRARPGIPLLPSVSPSSVGGRRRRALPRAVGQRASALCPMSVIFFFYFAFLLRQRLKSRIFV